MGKIVALLMGLLMAGMLVLVVIKMSPESQVDRNIVAGEQNKVWPTATRAQVLPPFMPGDVVEIDGKLGIVTCKNGLCRNEQGEFYVIPKPGGSALVEGWYPASRMKYISWISAEKPTPRP